MSNGMSGTEMSDINKAIFVLQRTHDGDDLHPTDLKLTELAVNGFLNEKGAKAFDTLYRKVQAGKYQSPFETWFHGIEHMTVGRTGVVYWRGVQVEHYTWPFSDDAKAQAERLATICRAIEARGETVNMASVFDEYGRMQRK